MNNRFNYNKLIKNHFFGFLIIIFIHLPLIILGENSYIHVSDNLSLDHLFHHLLKKFNHLFCLNPNHEIESILNGIKTSTFHSSFSLINIFYIFLPSFWAYVLNSIVVKTVGFYGTYWLVNEFSKIKNKTIFFLLALFYSTIPVFTIYGISISGLPLLFMAFFSLAKSSRVYLSFVIIIFYTFYSHFFLVGPFIIFSIIIFGILNFKKFDLFYWKGLLGFILLSLIFNYNFIYNYLFGEIPHRQEFISYKSFSFFESSLRSIFIFLKGNYHFSQIFILPILLLVAVNKKIKKTYSLILLVIFICFFTGFYELFINSLFGDELNLPFDFSRFYILVPLLILFILIKSSEGKINFNATILIICLQIVINLGMDQDIVKNIISFKNQNTFKSYINNKIIDPLNSYNKDFPLRNISDYGFFGPDKKLSHLSLEVKNSSYKNFYCESVFKKIENFISEEKKSFRTINVGFFPAITQYNGFYTLDGYHNYYPLSYKKKFFNIIKDEIKKEKELLAYFENRANTCFLLSSELSKTCGYNCNKYNSLTTKISNLNINTYAFKKMNGKYLFSSVEILNYEAIGFDFLRSFKSKDCDYIIYLYIVI
tara:strand:+ start:5259 stop:7046 length:1788 start_codon:yes stop_codon:yes gene_type:complete